MSSNRSIMAVFRESSLLDAGSSAYLEQLYEAYLNADPSLPKEWRLYFEKLPKVGVGSEVDHLQIQAQFRRLVRHDGFAPTIVGTSTIGNKSIQEALLRAEKQVQVHSLIEAYRLLGHLQADLDPLNLRQKAIVPELMLSYHHLSEKDLSIPFGAGSLPGSKERPLQQIIEDLKRIYCGTFVSEFMHIPDSPERLWVQEQVEMEVSQKDITPEIRHHILEQLAAAEGLEKYLGAKYPGAKRFSLEGTDSLIVALDTIIQEGSMMGIKEVVIGMAHRGRLNVLVNLLGKTPNQLFDEFEGKHYNEKLESGDVKYHQGFSSDVVASGGKVHLLLAFNPSHLEIVTPVVCGLVKAKQQRRLDNAYMQVLSIVVHGDSAFSGQGIVMETLNMSKTRGFEIGGTIHIIVNNQIGFTTSDPKDTRSTLYCSDIGKMIEVPIFHVNANDPEAVYKAMRLALKYRAKFKKDIIIDLVGYRRQGHNEADEPAVTQPGMYQIIRKLPTVLKLYSDKLIETKMISKEEAEKINNEYRESLDSRQQPVVRNLINDSNHEFSGDWTPYTAKDWRVPTVTGVSISDLKELAQKQTTLPEGFVLHPRVQKIIEDRRKMTSGELPLDWGYAETLAYATLLNEEYLVRLSGQDVGRGTFFHRHAILHNQTDNQTYIPLKHLAKSQGEFTVVNSLLSEAGVLAFEYGFAQTEPKGLIIWEAQFGDFANGAQVVIDQFISSGEQKWGRLCGLTLFLPHGYEGQGAEHSSARLERYLQLCAQQNMQVCVPTTPAQLFHMLRRQVLRPIRKPLIVMTPKSLLRHKLAVSTVEQLERGSFLPIIPEVDPISIESVKRVILCTGKIYYELLEKRRSENKAVVIIRVEQLYPFPDCELKEVLQSYNKVQEIVWCQEEPKNQGAWYNIQHHLKACLLAEQRLQFVGREPSAAPAVGYLHLHQAQQNTLVREALG